MSEKILHVTDDTVTGAARDGTVFALDLVSGRELWSTEVGGEVEAGAAVADDVVVYAGNTRGDLFALEPAL